MTNAGHTGTPIADESGEILSPKGESLRKLGKGALALATLKALGGVALDVLSVTSAQAATPGALTDKEIATVSARFPKLLACMPEGEKMEMLVSLNKLLQDPDKQKLALLDGAVDLIETTCSPKEKLPTAMAIYVEFLNDPDPSPRSVKVVANLAPGVKPYFMNIASKATGRDSLTVLCIISWSHSQGRQLSDAG